MGGSHSDEERDWDGPSLYQFPRFALNSEPKMAAPEPGTIAVLAEKPYGLVYLLADCYVDQLTGESLPAHRLG
jgi:hypothetical protein